MEGTYYSSLWRSSDDAHNIPKQMATTKPNETGMVGGRGTPHVARQEGSMLGEVGAMGVPMLGRAGIRG